MIIDVIQGGPGREAMVSRRSGAAVAAALAAAGHDVAVVDLTAADLTVARLRPGAVVFNVVHGTYGEDGQVQAVLEAAGVAFVGSDAAVSRLCMDKQATKECLAKAGIRVPWGVVVDLARPFRPTDLKVPHHGGLVMKPVDDGSSVGLKLIANPGWLLPAAEELLREIGPRRVLVEERLPGPEYTVAVIDTVDGPRALPPLAIAPASGVFDFDAKYLRSDTSEVPVAEPAVAAELARLAVAAHAAASCRDLSRTDVMRCADGGYAVLEINTLPGMTGTSLTPKAALAAGITMPALCDGLVRRAAARLMNTGTTP